MRRRLTERDFNRIVRRVILEEEEEDLVAADLSDCISFITKGGASSIAEPRDPRMAGQGTTITDVEIRYNPTVSPGYRSVTMSKNGVDFCSTKVG